MTIQIDLSPEAEALLSQQAAREGKEAASYVQELVEESLEWREQDFVEALDGVQRGLADSEAGRVKPLSQVIEDARQRHRFLESWPNAMRDK